MVCSRLAASFTSKSWTSLASLMVALALVSSFTHAQTSVKCEQIIRICSHSFFGGVSFFESTLKKNQEVFLSPLIQVILDGTLAHLSSNIISHSSPRYFSNFCCCLLLFFLLLFFFAQEKKDENLATFVSNALIGDQIEK